MNSVLEEASRISGANNFTTLIRVLIPIMLPAIIAIELLSMLTSLQAFEIEQILGPPAKFYVFSTWIYDKLYAGYMPRYDTVSAMSVLVIVFAVMLILLQRWLIGGRQYTTINGKFQSRKLQLAKGRWPAFALMMLLMLVIIGVPAVFSLLGTFMKLFGFFTADPWTLKNWQTALNDPFLLHAFRNTMVLALATAFCAVFVLSLIAYVIVRTKYVARDALDFISWLPFSVPGIILSLGLLTMFLLPPFRPLYGTMFTLVLALLISGMPFAVQTMKSNLMQLGNELEEASWVSGGSWFYTYRRVVLPLIRPMLVVIGVLSLIAAARNISQVALLSNTAIRPLSILQLDYIAGGKYEVAAVIATLLLFVSLALALVARLAGYRSIG